MKHSLGDHVERPAEPTTFREMVLQRAERLRGQDLRELADDLHALAREKGARDGALTMLSRVHDDGACIWL